jgi:predicted O-methyltransferase YrrM
MNLEKFVIAFDRFFPRDEIARPTTILEDHFVRSYFDPCFDVNGMTCVKKQLLLRLACSFLGPGEAYVEVGTFQGKSLISAIHERQGFPVYACDNFSEFKEYNSLEILMANLERYGLRERVKVFDADFRNIMTRTDIPDPVGVYFFDGAHDYDSQYQGIVRVEPLLAPRALVIVDDWRFAKDSESYARAATEDAIKKSQRSWAQLYDLPARLNGDHALWWNGVAVFSTMERS